MPTNNHYDVIIIGSGAGGGTLAYKLAPIGQEDSYARTRRLRAARKRQLEPARRQPRRQIQHQGNMARQGRQASSTRTPTTTSAATRNFSARRCFVCARKTSARSRITAASRRHGRSATTRWSPTTPQPSISTTSTANAAKIRRSHKRARRYPHPAVSHEPRIQHLSDDFARPGLRPFHTPLGVMLDEKNPHTSRCIRCDTCDGFPCLVNAKSDAQVCAVDPALDHPNVTLMTNAYVNVSKPTLPAGRSQT